ncbi:MAG TPA: hypothetical protein VGD22_11385 [Sphingobacteriaceae bacterium]
MAVLITGAAAAGAYRLQRTLELGQIIFADQQDLPKALFSTTQFFQIPPGNSPAFAHQLLRFSLDHGIDMIFPLRRDELISLSEAKKLFEEYTIDIIVPDSGEVAELLKNSASGGDEIVIAKDGMLLSGQFLEQNDLPALTGLFICPSEQYSELKLFTVD